MKKSNVDEFVRKYADLVYRISYTILKDKENAEDVFQDVFVKLCGSNLIFFSEEHEKAWIIKVTKNQCYDFMKKKDNCIKEEINEEVLESSDSLNVDNSSVLQTVMSLPEKNRILVYLFYYEGYKLSEISDMLDENVSTLKSRLVKSREMLKERLGEEI